MIRQEPGTVATVGYEGLPAETLLEVFSDEGATIVVDVRKTPQSRKAGLSKRKLAESLGLIGISYRHMPELGNPKENREPFRLGHPSAVALFKELLKDEPAKAALQELRDLSSKEAIVLLCYERDAASCHRSVITEALESMSPNITITHVESE